MAIKMKSSGKKNAGGDDIHKELIAAKEEQKQAQQKLQQAKKEAKVKLKQAKKDSAIAKKEQKKANVQLKKEKKAAKQQQKMEAIAANPAKLAKKMQLMMLILVLIVLIAAAVILYLVFFANRPAASNPLPAGDDKSVSSGIVDSGGAAPELDDLSVSASGNTQSPVTLDSAGGAVLDSGAAPGAQMQAPKLEIDRVTLELPDFVFSSENSLEAAVHRDVHAFLQEKDDRPGVQFEAIVIAGQFTKDDGTLRVLTYVWGNRYAVSQNTFIEYGSLAGPVALDYKRGSDGGYELQKINLARSGDAYRDSVMELCGPKTEVGKSMIRKEYDVELHMQMCQLLANYIAQNNVNVKFYSVGGDVYNSDGTFYVDPTLVDESSSEEQVLDSQPVQTNAEGESDPASEYDYIRSLPQ